MKRISGIRRSVVATSVAAAGLVGLAALPATAGAEATVTGNSPASGHAQGQGNNPEPGTTQGQGAAAGGAAGGAGTSQLEQRLVRQLQLRATQLTNLSKEVSAATALTPSDQGALEQKLATATTSINGLIQSVPTDDRAQLRAAWRTMIYQNRVFAVLTPQVYEVIASDTVAGQAAALVGDEPALQAEVSAAQGQVGYHNAESHDRAFVRSVSDAQRETTRVSSDLLAQTPQDFPRDRSVFVRSNRQILAAAEALARASYDKTIVALATNGYTGS